MLGCLSWSWMLLPLSWQVVKAPPPLLGAAALAAQKIRRAVAYSHVFDNIDLHNRTCSGNTGQLNC